MRLRLIHAVALLALATLPSRAAAPPAAPLPPALRGVPKPTDFQIADIERIATWRPGGPRLMFLKDGNDQWYRIEIVEPCMDLFPGKDPKFITLTDTAGKRYSAVVIERHQCDVTKIEKTEKPAGDPYVAPPPKPLVKPAAKAPAKK